MAIAVGAADAFLVLDQVNQRVQRFAKGVPSSSFAITDTVQDLAIGSAGHVVALDRLVGRNIQVFDDSGALVNETPLVGEGLKDGGDATGVFADEDGIWVERQHSSLIRVADPSGSADKERPEMPGRLTRDRRLVVSAIIASKAEGVATVTAFDRLSLETQWSRPIHFPAPIVYILTLDSDRVGSLYVAADVGREAPDEPYELVDERIVVLRLDGTGAVTGSLSLPAPRTGDEMLRPLSIADDGSVWMMLPDEEGLSIVRFTF